MTARQTSTKDRPLPVPDFEVFATANRRAVAALTRCGADAFRHAIDMNRQYLDFVGRRVAEDAHVADTLCTCRSPQDAVKAVGDFYSRAVDQYADGMRVLREGAATLAGDAMKLGEAEAKVLLETGTRRS